VSELTNIAQGITNATLKTTHAMKLMDKPIAMLGCRNYVLFLRYGRGEKSTGL
jgi:hypothetical protein